MIITVAAQKGGVSKTTTAAAIAQAFDYVGKHALLIDVDAQGSATLIYGSEIDLTDESGRNALIMGTVPAEDLVQETTAGTIIPASDNDASLENFIKKQPKENRPFLLKAAIEPLKKKYDCIVLDTAPGLGTGLMQALAAADAVIIPLLCDPQALQGLHQVTDTIDYIKEEYNPGLKIAAVLLTQYQSQATLTRQYEELITEHCQEMGLPLAETRVRRSIRLQEAQAERANLFDYNAKCNPAIDYMTFFEEIGLLQPEKE